MKLRAVQLVDGVEVDRDRHQLAVDPGAHAMLVGTPVGEAREIGEDLARVGVEDVRPVLVDEHAVLVVVVVGVAADVRPLVDEQDGLVQLRGQPLRQDAAGETGANDQIVEH